MIRPEDIQAIGQRIGELLPPGLKEGREDLRRNLRAAVSARLDKLDLVTREEFEIQRSVLLRSRELLEQMSARIDALEAALARQRGSDG